MIKFKVSVSIVVVAISISKFHTCLYAIVDDVKDSQAHLSSSESLWKLLDTLTISCSVETKKNKKIQKISVKLKINGNVTRRLEQGTCWMAFGLEA